MAMFGLALLPAMWTTASAALMYPPRYQTEPWKELITGNTCPPSTSLTLFGGGLSEVQLTCEQIAGGGRRFRFPAGLFDIDEQVEVPPNTHIEGNKNPIDPADKAREPDPADQTYFVATQGVTDVNAPYCGTNNNLQPGDAQKLRIGFLLNSNTVVQNFNFQGRDTTRPFDNGNLCGGAVFETPGCVSPGLGDGVGNAWANAEKRMGCYDHTGAPNDLITGNGRGAENILIDSVRLNGMLLADYKDNYAAAPGSQVAVWVAMTKDGSATKNVRVNNLVSMTNRGDGINFHGNVQDSIAENCHIENTGDDIYAVWGAYAENPSGIVFRNNVGKNPGVVRDYGYGVCVAVYGARDVTFTGTKCYDLGAGEWNPGQVPRGNDRCKNGANCNSCMAIVHDNWFGAVYPDGNTINIYSNEYMDMSGTPIPEWERPQVRADGGSHANVVKSGPALDQVASKTSATGPSPTVGTTGSRRLGSFVTLCAVAGMAVGAFVAVRRAHAPRTPAPASDSSACEDGLLVE